MDVCANCLHILEYDVRAEGRVLGFGLFGILDLQQKLPRGFLVGSLIELKSLCFVGSTEYSAVTRLTI